MQKNSTAKVVIVLAFLALITLPSGSLQKASPPAPSNVKVLDAELMDQNGVQVRFVSDVVGDRIIALNFIYTDCSTACPVVSAIFSKLQGQLGEKLKQDVRLVSLSVNPAADTPERLKAYAKRFHAGSEWVWLTGEKAQVDALLKGLGVYSIDYTTHAPLILVGDPMRNVWTRFNGFANPKAIAARIDELLNSRNEK